MKKKAKNLLPKLGFPLALSWVWSCSTLNHEPPAKFMQDLKIAESRLEQTQFALTKQDFVQARRLAEAALLDTRVVVSEWQTEQAKKLVTEERQHLNYLESRQAEIKAAVAERKTTEGRAEEIRQRQEQLLREASQYDKDSLKGGENTLPLAERSAELDKAAETQRAIERESAQLNQRKDELLQENNTRPAPPSSDTQPVVSPPVTEAFTEEETQQIEQGLVVILKNISQPAGRVGLTTASMRLLAKVVNFLKENPNRAVLVRGYADSYGSEKYNLYLSQRRAEVIRSNLVSKGVAVERISAKGYGSEYPTDYPQPDEGLWADIVILNQ
jgi:outer membrane protein OmpA-like peptidoglycan-associated protein